MHAISSKAAFRLVKMKIRSSRSSKLSFFIQNMGVADQGSLIVCA